MSAASEVGCKIMRVEAALPTNSEKGHADKDKINMQTVQATGRPVIINAQIHGPGRTSYNYKN